MFLGRNQKGKLPLISFYRRFFEKAPKIHLISWRDYFRLGWPFSIAFMTFLARKWFGTSKPNQDHLNVNYIRPYAVIHLIRQLVFLAKSDIGFFMDINLFEC